MGNVYVPNSMGRRKQKKSDDREPSPFSQAKNPYDLYDKDHIKKQFKEFLEPKNSLTKFIEETYDIPDDMILIKVCTLDTKQNPEESSGLLGVQEAYRIMVPVAQVLAGAYEPGTIIAIPDYMRTFRLNPKWVEFKESLKERPEPETHGEEPEKYLSLIEQKWGGNRFNPNKFCPPGGEDEEEQFIYLVRKEVATAKVKKPWLIFQRYASKMS